MRRQLKSPESPHLCVNIRQFGMTVSPVQPTAHDMAAAVPHAKIHRPAQLRLVFQFRPHKAFAVQTDLRQLRIAGRDIEAVAVDGQPGRNPVGRVHSTSQAELRRHDLH